MGKRVKGSGGESGEGRVEGEAEGVKAEWVAGG